MENIVKQDRKGEIHSAICDACNFDIIGIRYKCINCKDFDLCQYCEEYLFENKLHALDHVFLKIEIPLPKKEKRGDILYKNLYTGEMDDNNDKKIDSVHRNIPS